MNTDNIKLGIAPIAWTNDDLPDLGAENTFRQCVSEMALAGFSGCEVGNKYPKDVKELKKQLDMRGLSIANQWFSSFILTQPMEKVERDFAAQCEFLHAMGAKIIGASEQSYSIQGTDIPVFEGKYVMNAKEWEKLAAGGAPPALGAAARRPAGVRLFRHIVPGGVIPCYEHVPVRYRIFCQSFFLVGQAALLWTRNKAPVCFSFGFLPVIRYICPLVSWKRESFIT